MIWALLLQVVRLKVLETQLMAEKKIKQHCGKFPPSPPPKTLHLQQEITAVRRLQV